MGLIAKQTGEGITYDPISQGVHIAVCYALIDIGTQYDPTYDKEKEKLYVIWEVPGERIEIEKDGVKKNLPKVISQPYTNSLGEKANLRHDLVCWRGREFTKEELDGFDLRNIVGKACQIQVIHNKKGDKLYTNIGAIMPLPKGTQAPKPENPEVIFSIDDLVEGDPNLPGEIPEWIQKKIKESKEYQAIFNKANAGSVTTPSQSEPREQSEPPIDDDNCPF